MEPSSEDVSLTCRSLQLKPVDFVGGPIPCVALDSTRQGVRLWYGQGPFLRRRHLAKEDEDATEILVFPDENVHGIIIHPREGVWVWGGRRLAFVQSGKALRLRKIIQNDRLKINACLPDWIWDVRSTETMTHASNKFALAVGLAHNSVQFLHGTHMEDTSISLTWGPRVDCSNKCISYCLAMHTHTRHVAVGSVTQGILLWDLPDACCNGKATGTLAAHVTSQLTDHQGVIHGLAFSDSGNCLASASDDRTVRLWSQQSQNWKLLWTAYGHTARCWKVKFAHSDLQVVSTAEDGTARVWDSQSGSLMATLRGHASPNIWSLTLSNDFLVTGGGNGTIAVYPWRARGNFTSTDNPITRLKIAVPDIRVPTVEIPAIDEAESLLMQDTPRKKAKGKSRKRCQEIMGMQFCTLHKKDCLLVATRLGGLIAFDLHSSVWHRYRDWYSQSFDARFGMQWSGGVSFALHADLPWVAIGLNTGRILLAKLKEPNAQEERDDYALLSSSGSLPGPRRLAWLTPHLLASFHAQTLCLWHMNLNDDSIDGNYDHERFSSGLQAVITCVAFNDCEQFRPGCVAVGDNRGHVSTYKLGYANFESTSPFETPVSIRRLHERENVNDLYWTNSTSLMSVGNDGRIVQSTLLDDGTLVAGVSIPVFSYSGISRILPLSTPLPGDLLVAGYVSNVLSVADPFSSYEFFTLDTGGRGRGTTLHVDNQDKIRVAICSNRKDGPTEILLEHQPIVSHFSEQRLACSFGISLHHETIFDTCAIPISDNRTIFITGSEDCSSRLLLWSYGTIVWSQMLTPQESGVRAICASPVPDSSSTFVVVGGSKLCLQLFLVHHGTSGAGHLRVDALNSRTLSSAATIDHRINALTCSRIAYRDSGTHLIACGDSSGQIFAYVLDERSNKTSTGSFIYESARPIISLDFFVVRNQIWLVFGTSGGDIGVLKISLQESDAVLPDVSSQLVGKYQGHTMGSNAVATVLSTQGEELTVWIASGGDDQRLTVCQAKLLIQDDHSTSVYFEEPIFIDLASSSAIRSVRWINDFQIATVSYSGELSLWRLDEDDWKLACSETAVVGDINGMAVAKTGLDSHVLIGVVGIGLQLFEMRPST